MKRTQTISTHYRLRSKLKVLSDFMGLGRYFDFVWATYDFLFILGGTPVDATAVKKIKQRIKKYFPEKTPEFRMFWGIGKNRDEMSDGYCFFRQEMTKEEFFCYFCYDYI